MLNIFRPIRGAAIVGAVLALAACKTDVTNPNLIDAGTFDPSSDGPTISLSAQTVFFQAFQADLTFTGYLSEEILFGSARAETNDVTRRNFNQLNLDINVGIYRPMSLAFIANDKVVQTLSSGAGAASDINLARAQMNAAFSLVFLGEATCQTTINNGPALTTDQVMDSAITRFTQAIAVASASSDPGASDIVNASRVGLARAALQKGDYSTAATTATLVPASFAGYYVINIDDPANRGLGNTMYAGATSRLVPHLYRALQGDVRVPSDSDGSLTADKSNPWIAQLKYPSYDTDMRIASYLEAQYIIAEADLKQGQTAAAQALIAQQIAAGGPSAPALTSAPTDLIGELMELRARDFWLEGKKLGDLRRNPDDKAYYDPPGTPFYKGAGAPFGDQTCFPIPQEEITANPNLS